MGIAIATESIRSTETRTFNGDGCPTQWLFQRRDEYTGVEQPEYAPFIRGHVGHAGIELLIQGASLDKAMDLIDELYDSPLMEAEWIETSKCNKKGMADELAEIFVAFQDQYAEYYDGLDVELVEYELDCYTPAGTHLITTVDAMFRDTQTSRPVLVDWKLGTSKSGKAMQLFVYWWGLKQVGYVTEDDYFRGFFHYVQYANPISQVGSYPGDEMVEAYIDNAERNRRSGLYLPNPSYNDCHNCLYQKECPLFGDDPADLWDYITKVEIEYV